MSRLALGQMSQSQFVEQLQIDHLEPGLHRLRMPMVHDGLGREVQLPILVLKGTRPGPCLGMTAAIHGNEVNGVPVIHQLVRQLEPQKLKGSLIAVPVINFPGFLTHQRGYEDGVDLNRIMPGKENGTESEAFANRFFKLIIKRFDFLVDLHTASFGRANSLYIRVDVANEWAHKMALLQRPQIILHSKAADGSLRGVATKNGIPAITVEIGNPDFFQEKLIKRTLVGLKAVMGELNMIARSKLTIRENPIVCKDSYWLYTDCGGILKVDPVPTERISKGDRIASICDIYGDSVCEYHAPRDGIVIGKSIDPVASTGARILHLGILA